LNQDPLHATKWLLAIYAYDQFAHTNAHDDQIQKGRRVTAKHAKALEKAGVKSLNTPLEYLLDKIIAQDLVDKETGEILCATNTVISEEVLELLITNKVKKHGDLFQLQHLCQT
jgi:DNA-directed RNA polymerase subunit beta